MYRQIFLIILLALALTGYGGDALAEYQRDFSVNQSYGSKPELSSLVESQSEKQLKAILNMADQNEARLLEAVLDPKELESEENFLSAIGVRDEKDTIKTDNQLLQDEKNLSSDLQQGEFIAPESGTASPAKTLIILKTSCVKYAGTDANIQAQLSKLEGGFTDWVTLDNPGNDRERCDEDSYYVTFPKYSGPYMRLRTDSRGVAPSWKLLWTEVYPPDKPSSSRIFWDIWLGDSKYRGIWCSYSPSGSFECP